MIFETLITGLMALILMKLWQKHIKRPMVWVIDDNPMDIILFKMNLRLDDYDVRYFNSVKGLAFKAALTPPDAVISDYFLNQDNINGDQVYKYFKRNGIPVHITTAHDGDLIGIDPKCLTKKSVDKSYYRHLESWVHAVTA